MTNFKISSEIYSVFSSDVLIGLHRIDKIFDNIITTNNISNCNSKDAKSIYRRYFFNELLRSLLSDFEKNNISLTLLEMKNIDDMYRLLEKQGPFPKDFLGLFDNFLNMYFFKQVSHYQGSINTNNEYKDKSFKFLHNESELRRRVQQALSIKNHHMESIIIPIIGSSTYEVPNLAWTVSSFPHSLGISAGSYEYDQILDEAIRYSQYRELQANL